jgi:cytochrome d ubiquinol oxidase subunit II
MLETVIIFLALSLLLYVLLGGADFGAGIIEAFSSKGDEQEKEEVLIINTAIGPVWEANHMWLIITVVILFMGFPPVYSLMSVSLHIPLLLMLLGIIMRGCAFVFRHYDAIKDESQKYYTRIFHISSIWAPFFLGVISGAMILGRIEPSPADFYSGYISPWLNLFSFSTGLFTCCLFAFLAAIYLIGETDDNEMRRSFIRKARNANIATVISGAIVFICAEIDGLRLVTAFLEYTVCIICLLSATVSLPALWYFLKKGEAVFSRLLAGFQAAMILAAWFWLNFPVIMRTTSGDIDLFSSGAPPAVMDVLGMALLTGSLFILPFLLYLLKVFKLNRKSPER